MQQTNTKPCEMCGIVSDNNLIKDDKQKRLPTIIEGIDTTVNISAAIISNAENARTRIYKALPHRWSITDTDDSLLDVDLDSFRLINEKRNKIVATKKATVDVHDDGIDNPTYEPDDEDDDDDENARIPKPSSDKLYENNYKCTKYINSCPDDAYNVEDVNDYKYATPKLPVTDNNNKQMPKYVKNCNEQVHCHHTKDILKDIYEKLTLLTTNPTDSTTPVTTTTATNTTDDSNSSNGSGSDTGNSRKYDDDTKSEDNNPLKNSIAMLKKDLENYLKLMNEQDELEIKQFCSGLSKNYKLLTMQHALAKRTRSNNNADNGSELFSNHSCCSSGHGSDGSNVVYSDMSSEHYENVNADRKIKNNDLQNFRARAESIDSVQCSSGSDSNFQLHRRHSDSACSSWDEIHHTSSSSSQRDDASQSVKSDVAAIQIETITTDQTIIIDKNLVAQKPTEIVSADIGITLIDEKDLMLELHRNKPSIWQQYYGSKRLKYSNVMKKFKDKIDISPTMAYVSFFHTHTISYCFLSSSLFFIFFFLFR